MKRKAIKRIIGAKLLAWTSAIEADVTGNPLLAGFAGLSGRVNDSFIVTGGCIVSLLQNEEPNDFDVYLADRAVCAELARYYTMKLSSAAHIEEFDGGVLVYIPSSGCLRANSAPEKGSFSPVCITSNAISLEGGVQVITRFVGTPAEVHRNFDFAHTKSYYTKEGGLVLDPVAVECILMKELRYVGSLYPLSSIIRIRKFISRGWTVSAGEILKAIFDVSALDLTDLAVLRGQLIGVDVSYFMALISSLEAKTKGDSPEWDRDYLFALITDLFDEIDHNED